MIRGNWIEHNKNANYHLRSFPRVAPPSAEAIDEQIEREAKRLMKRRVLCEGCCTYKSVSGVCFC